MSQGREMPSLNHLTRPTSLEEMTKRRIDTGFQSLWDNSKEHGLNFQPYKTDVIISPFAKCGTTWLQHIVYGLKTHGNMDFDDVSRVVPWIETAQALGLNLQAPQIGAFRAYKSHLSWDDVPKGGRYIVSIRDSKDAVVSLFHFFNNWMFEANSVSIADFARKIYLTDRFQGGYWRHLISWWEHRQNNNVLLLCYEEMKRNTPASVRRIAAFLGITLDETLLSLIVRQSSLDFMLKHGDRFNDLLMRELMVSQGLHPAGGDASKVRRGRVGDYQYELPTDVIKEMDEVWHAEVTPKLGYPSYIALQRALAQEIAP